MATSADPYDQIRQQRIKERHDRAQLQGEQHAMLPQHQSGSSQMTGNNKMSEPAWRNKFPSPGVVSPAAATAKNDPDSLGGAATDPSDTAVVTPPAVAQAPATRPVVTPWGDAVPPVGNQASQTTTYQRPMDVAGAFRDHDTIAKMRLAGTNLNDAQAKALEKRTIDSYRPNDFSVTTHAINPHAMADATPNREAMLDDVNGYQSSTADDRAAIDAKYGAAPTIQSSESGAGRFPHTTTAQTAASKPVTTSAGQPFKYTAAPLPGNENWMEQVVRMNPNIGKAGTPENTAFVAEFKKHGNPNLAVETAASLTAQSTPGALTKQTATAAASTSAIPAVPKQDRFANPHYMPSPEEFQGIYPEDKELAAAQPEAVPKSPEFNQKPVTAEQNPPTANDGPTPPARRTTWRDSLRGGIKSGIKNFAAQMNPYAQAS